MLEFGARQPAAQAGDPHRSVSPEVGAPLRSMTQSPGPHSRCVSVLAGTLFSVSWCLEADGIWSLARYIGGHQLPGSGGFYTEDQYSISFIDPGVNNE